MATASDIGKMASARTKKQFADELSRHTTLTAKEIESLFPRKSDRDAMLTLVRIVQSNADDNEKKAKIVEQAGAVSGAILKVVSRLVPGV